MGTCVFCKIVAGKLSSAKIYEDAATLAFLDISPINKGHVLVIPKKHSVNLLDVDEKTLSQTMFTVQKITRALRKYADGVNIGQNNDRAAGQIVDHLHVHVIPRYKKDGLEAWPGRGYKEGEIEAVAEEIKNLL
ncbi:MAG: HIT family protein [Nanoarchaeota archaeon]